MEMENGNVEGAANLGCLGVLSIMFTIAVGVVAAIIMLLI